jgi:hypothetical protein
LLGRSTARRRLRSCAVGTPSTPWCDITIICIEPLGGPAHRTLFRLRSQFRTADSITPYERSSDRNRWDFHRRDSRSPALRFTHCDGHV